MWNSARTKRKGCWLPGLVAQNFTEWTKATADFGSLSQGNRTDEEYARHTQEVCTILGDGFGPALATKIVQGIRRSYEEGG
jgi:hypothetical protein